MGLGAFQLLDAPTAHLEVQTFQCPQPAWRSGATANVALAARVGNHTVVIVGDQLLVFDEPNTGAPPSLVVESEDAAEHDYEVQSTAGEFHIRSSAVRNGKRRWRLESRDFVISSHSKPAPAGLVAMGHMMDYQIGLGPQHVVLSGNSGLCTKRCSGVTLAGSSECVHADCNVVADEQTLFNQVNASLFTHLLERCSGLNNPEPRSPCDTPTSSEACRTTGFPLASATAACAPLQGSTVPDVYESCIYDCCVTGDVDFCRGLAEDSEAQIKEFEQELVTDGRFVNIDANSAFYQLNRTLPSPRDDLWVCSVAFGGRDDTVETVVLPNGIGLPGTLQEVSANTRNVLLLLDAEALNTSLELESAFEAAHLSSGQLYPCTEFHFAPVRIGFEGVAALAASLRRGAMPRLEHLTLSTNLIGSNATIALVNAIRAGGPRGPILRNLKVLNLRSNLIGDDGVNGLASALKDGVLGSLQFVDLADNPVNSSVKALLTRARSGLVVR